MVTTYEIAKKAGVSQATVSRVLNGSSSVNPETKQKVMDWVRKLDYQPNNIARCLSKSRSYLLGLTIPDMDNPYFTSILNAVEQAADLNGYTIILCHSRGNLQKEKQCINIFRSHQVDGILLIPVSKKKSHLNIPQQCKIPVVSITQNIPSFASVHASHERGGELVATHLVELGHSKIAYIGSKNDEKFKGLKKALSKNGISFDKENLITIEQVWNTLGSLEAHTKLNAYLGKKRRLGVTALFAINDLVAFISVQILRQHGYEVPQDIVVVGYDNTFLANEAHPQLTSVAQPTDEIAYLALDHLLNKIADGEKELKQPKIVLEPTLVIRESTRNSTNRF